MPALENTGVWQVVGAESFSAGRVGSPNLTINAIGTPFIAYSDGANGNKATTMTFNGTNWVAVGNSGFSPGM